MISVSIINKPKVESQSTPAPEVESFLAAGKKIILNCNNSLKAVEDSSRESYLPGIHMRVL